ncbi:hypothetical protein [Eoetvoesiella caeni]
MVHWIYYLETNPKVKAFNFISESDRDSDSVWGIDVILSNGARINHQVGREAGENSAAIELQKDPSGDNASRLENRVFTDKDLQPYVKVSLRWLKPIGFATALRNHEYPHQTLILLDYFKQRKNGDIGQILSNPDVCEYEPALILGLIARLAIRGHIQLDLTANSFGYRTPWIWSVKEH